MMYVRRRVIYAAFCAGIFLLFSCSSENASKPHQTDGDTDADLEEAMGEMEPEELAEEEDSLPEADNEPETAEEEQVSGFTFPDMDFPPLPEHNTEGASYQSMYALSMADGSVAVLWVNALGLRYNRTNPDRSAWLGEGMLLSLEDLGEDLKTRVTPPRGSCPETGPDTICYEELEWDFWTVSVWPFLFTGKNRTHRLWQDAEGYYHIPMRFSTIDSLYSGILDMRLSNVTLAADFTIVRDFGREANRLLDQGRNVFDEFHPGIDELEWGRDARGCGVALYAYAGMPYPTGQAIHLVRQTCCAGIWDDPEVLYKVQDAPGEGDGHDTICCPPWDPQCLEEEPSPDCLYIRDIIPTRDASNRFVSPVMLDLRIGNIIYAHVAVYPEKEKPRARVIASYRYNPEDMFSSGAFFSYREENGDTWLQGISYPQWKKTVLSTRSFNEQGFLGDRIILDQRDCVYDLKPVNTLACETDSRRCMWKHEVNPEIPITAATCGDSGVNKIIEAEIQPDEADKAAYRVIRLEDDNPAAETPEGTWEDLAVFDDGPGRRLLAAQRVLPPFSPEQNTVHDTARGKFNWAFHNIMVYQEDGSPRRKDIAGIINSEGYRWNYGDPWWLDADADGLPMLLMTQGGYATTIDPGQPEQPLTLLPPVEVPMGAGVPQHNAGDIPNGVTINGCGGECNITDIVSMTQQGGFETLEVHHFDTLDEGACTAQSTADGLTLYTCRGDDPYTARTYSTRYCGSDGACTGHRAFAPPYFSATETTLFSHSRGHAAVSLLRDQQTGEQHFQLWLSGDKGETWDFLGFDSIGRAGAIQWAPLGDTLVGIATRCISPEPCRMRPFTLTPGAGVVQWGNAAIPGTTDGSQGNTPEIAVRPDGMMLLMWRQPGNNTECFAALYDPRTDAFSEAQSIALPPWATSFRTMRPFISDTHYCIAIEVFRRVEEQEGCEQTQTMWGCRAFEENTAH